MGAAAGSPGSVANVVRICARYGNLSILEDAYGINLRPLATFAADARERPLHRLRSEGQPGFPRPRRASPRRSRRPWPSSSSR
ncbi:MAG: fructose-bisphosphatase class III [Adlercreutzia equolifaciens]